MNPPQDNVDLTTIETTPEAAVSNARDADDETPDTSVPASQTALAPGVKYRNRELSWLAFNDRVLEEANDPTAPILERVKFLAIYASNLDEFFMVRVAALRRQIEAGIVAPGPDGLAPSEAMKQISAWVHQSHERIGQCFRDKIIPDLAAAGIFLLDEKSANPEQRAHLIKYFNKSIKAVMTPLAVDSAHPFPRLENKALYFCVELARKKKPANKPRTRLVLLQIPTQLFGRFIRIPSANDTLPYIRLDDVIRLNLDSLFPGDIVMGCYEIKIIRDAELEFDEEAADLLESITKSLEQRRTAPASRFLYDAEMPKRVLDMFCHQLKLTPGNMFPGARYHSFSDFFQFPGVEIPRLQFPPMPAQPIPALEQNTSMFAAIQARDYLLHHPYQKFDYVVRLLEQAAKDASVVSIKMTLYRVSPKSQVAEALAQAARRGKQVTVLVELKARFDEEANIRWSHKLNDAGAHVIFGLQGLKTHSKLCLIVRREGETLRRYCHLSTGNYNDRTAKVYSDLGLLTCNEEVCEEVEGVFNSLTGYAAPESYRHVLVAPEHLRDEILKRIRREAENTRAGKPAGIIAKMNSLVDQEIIAELYAASQTGVHIQLIIRGICCLIPGVPGLSDNIKVISILDRFLEHARIYIFDNAGNREYFLASADWMPRNLDRRVEVAFPIYDPAIKQQVQEIIDIQLADNTKARVLLPDNTSVINRNDKPPLRAQEALYEVACRVAEK